MTFSIEWSNCENALRDLDLFVRVNSLNVNISETVKAANMHGTFKVLDI